MQPAQRLPADINAAEPRLAMGLPRHYVAGLVDEARWSLASLVGAASDPSRLAAQVEDPGVNPGLRFCAGTLLALTGDPRIDPLAPATVDIPTRDVLIGTPHDEVRRVLDAYVGLSIRPEWIAKECPQHRVRVPRFLIARYPVTHEEYRLFLQDTGADYLPTSWHLGVFPRERANHPVWGVRHEWAQAYCRWLSRRTGRPFRLPREQEWECAAAGVEGREFPWGNAFSHDCANTVESGLLCTSPVGAFPAGRTPEGVFDMGGNVEEFVEGLYEPYPGGSLVEDDLSLARAKYPMTRGGCFSRFRDLARCRRRHGYFDSSLSACGFRLALTPPD